jgi:hypothetical protein
MSAGQTALVSNRNFSGNQRARVLVYLIARLFEHGVPPVQITERQQNWKYIIMDCEMERLLFGSGSSGGFSRRTHLQGVGFLSGSKDQESQKMINEEFNNMYVPSIIGVTKSRKTN